MSHRYADRRGEECLWFRPNRATFRSCTLGHDYCMDDAKACESFIPVLALPEDPGDDDVADMLYHDEE